MSRWELRHNCWRAIIERQSAGYVATLWREDTAAGRKSPEKSEAKPTQREARKWVYETINKEIQ